MYGDRLVARKNEVSRELEARIKRALEVREQLRKADDRLERCFRRLKQVAK